jgi:flavin-dependent dehydrogenase
MPVRATKRGDERTPLDGDHDVVICGASFAGLAAARELSGTGANVLMIDRYEVGERQTSACAAPTQWLENLGLMDAVRQTFQDLVIHTPLRTFRWRLPWTFSTFDYRELCHLLKEQSPDVPFDTAKVESITRGGAGGDPHTVHTDRGDLRAPLVVDALGWRRVLSPTPENPIQPPDARLSRGLEVHPHGRRDDLELWLDRRYVRAGYSWSFPAGDEVRVGVGSFDPRDKVKDPTVELAGELGVDPVGYQGNWIPHRIRPAAEGGVFFAGDSAGHCLASTAEGIRTALYFGLACGRELRAVVEGERTREQALARYDAFNEEHRWKFESMWRVQSIVSFVNRSPRAMTAALRLMDHQRFVDWSFDHYLKIAPPSFVSQGRPPAASGERDEHQRRSTPAGSAA